MSIRRPRKAPTSTSRKKTTRSTHRKTLGADVPALTPIDAREIGLLVGGIRWLATELRDVSEQANRTDENVIRAVVALEAFAKLRHATDMTPGRPIDAQSGLERLAVGALSNTISFASAAVGEIADGALLTGNGVDAYARMAAGSLQSLFSLVPEPVAVEAMKRLAKGDRSA
ncbi:hypothetical protein [Tianweitania sp.]|uniref:hypothetical protein n=1 Tax=Tianweitania sp. TaxID=2021634 RepID=UPI00289D1E31|nr:hypothetical protein [Tianweitania sp.]